MRALNGKRAMTLEERRARRRELDKDPFHHALTRKVANKYRREHRDEINARRRAKYAAMTPERLEAYRVKARAYDAAHKERRVAYWKAYAEKNREKLRARNAARYAKEGPGRVREYRARMSNDPEYIERVRSNRRKWYRKNKDRPLGYRWMFLQQWREKWRKVVDEGRIAEYSARCTAKTRLFFNYWLKGGEKLLEQIWKVKL